MRKLCPNLDREGGLQTVLEVPVPEEMFPSGGRHGGKRSWQNMIKSWIRANRPPANKSQPSVSVSFPSIYGGHQSSEIQVLLGVVGAPFSPLPVRSDQQPLSAIENRPHEASMAEYIMKQYTAAVGGERGLDAVESMYAVGKVRTVASGGLKGGGEVGGFVLWQKCPDRWCLELVFSGFKISAGSDGKVSWWQTPGRHSHGSSGPLRRFLQGFDSKYITKLFSTSNCIGEKTIDNEDCFILKLEIDSSILRARSNRTVELLSHTVRGYFSQRTGLLLHLQDSHLLRVKTSRGKIFWEISTESSIGDYRTLNGVRIPRAGKTSVSLLKFGGSSSGTRMEEQWTIEEADFNIQGLSSDCFLPPKDMENDREEDCGETVSDCNSHLSIKILGNGGGRINSSRIVAVDDEQVAEL